jgi:PEP-CTERM motif-containing protein
LPQSSAYLFFPQKISDLITMLNFGGRIAAVSFGLKGSKTTMKLINQIAQAPRAAKLSVLAVLFFTWVVVAAAPAKADTVFNVNAAVGNTPSGPYAGDAIAGTVTINTVTGAVDGIDLYSPTSLFPTFTNVYTLDACPGPNCVVFYDTGFAQYGELALGNTVGYTGGALGAASDINLAVTNQYGTADVQYDVTGNVAATPEPGSLSLMALGLSGLLFVLYRRRLLPNLHLGL